MAVREHSASESSQSPPFELADSSFLARVSIPEELSGELRRGQQAVVALPSSDQFVGEHIAHSLGNWLNSRWSDVQNAWYQKKNK